ncbi:MAG: CDP-alcohol phosphatidyltransferase family protein [Ruminococcaceae bacterium]|nr:CDP-alcohol phosphatidyltransferase family protein [Oscillospiraceae bacterium]
MRYSKKEIFTIPNALSVFRILLIPVYAVLYMKAQVAKDYIIAASVFIISALTDMVDGFIARRFNMRSRIGIMLDPFADKLTQGIVIICLTLRNLEILPLLIIFLIKEGFMFVMACRLLHSGKMLDGALWAGKICTTVLFVSMAALVVFENIPTGGVYSIVAICSVFMIISLISYAKCFFTASEHIRDIDE